MEPPASSTAAVAAEVGTNVTASTVASAAAAVAPTASPTTPTASMSPAPAAAPAAATPSGLASLPSAPTFATLDSYAHVVRALSDCVLERQLYALLDWPQVDAAAKAVVREGALSKACETWGVAAQQALHISKLALYDVQFLLPASVASDSRASLAALLDRVVSTSVAFRGSEAQVTALRAGTSTAVQLKDASDVEALLAAEGEQAEIDVAAAIEQSVLVAAREKQLKRPVLFIVVAAGKEVEDADKLVKFVQSAREQLKALGMGDGAVGVEIAALSSEAASWLDSLRAVPGAREALTIAPPSGPSNGASATDRTSSALLNSLRGGRASTTPDASLEDARVAFVRASDLVLSQHEAVATPTGPRASRAAAQQQQQQQQQGLEGGDENGTGEAGSALAGAKLSNKKKEALSQVPCKFFRANGCSAGNACPFAHTMPGEAQQKATCQWFLKGSCRFGHKCALAHILPGQPMSMDRKNKRAAQQGGGVMPGQQAQQQQQQGQGQQQQAGGSKQQQQRQSQHRQSGASVDLGRLPPAGPSGTSGGPGASRGRLPMSSFAANQRDLDFPFGLPDDLQATSPTPPPQRSAGAAAGNIHLIPGMDYDPSVLFAAQQSFMNELQNGTQRPLSVPRGEGRGSIQMDHLNGLGTEGAAPLGTPPSSRAFGTSPFSHPGGHSVFFSGSQDSEGGAGPLGRARAGTGQSGRSFGGRAEDVDAFARWRGSTSGAAAMLDEADDGAFNEEDFLPSSLSDLLTPAELERRRRSVLAAAAAGKLPGASQPATQSMPSGPGANLGTLWELGLRTNRAQRALEEEMRALERAAAELGSSSNSSSYGFAARNSHLLAQQQQQQQQRQTMHVPMAESDARVAAALANLQAQAAQANSTTSYSPGTRAALHAPGQSLPQGLAAGLSRLHLLPQPQRTPSGGNGVGGEGIGSGMSSHMLGAAGRRPSQLGVGSYDSELGPTAPSSVLAHRANPLSLAMARSIGGGGAAPGGGLGASLEQHHGFGGGQSPLSHGALGSTPSRRPHSSSIGQLPEGIAIPAGFPSSPGASALGAGTTPKHPGMHRVRTAQTNANAQGSPLALPTTGEEVDEAIFELE